MKRIILVEIEPIETYPPVISVLNSLIETKNELVLITVNASDNIKSFCKENGINLYDIKDENKAISKIRKQLHKIVHFFNIKKQVWDAIDKEYDGNSIIWIFSVVTLKYIGSKVWNYKYILHLFELAEHLSYFAKWKYPQIDLKRFCREAYKVIECEYNRAHITKVWFDLSELPKVLPNKLYLPKEPLYDKYVSDSQKELLKNLKNKKIILYQGILSPERPLDEFVRALDFLNDEFIFVIMTGSKVTYQSERLYVCSYIPAPYHLYVTQRAYIGVLCYFANSEGYSYTSPLNSIYCAPNKIFEYSRYGIPMLGNDIPGLTECIDKYNMGKCVRNLRAEEIAEAVQNISKNYEEMSSNSLEFYESVDIKKIIIEDII